VQQVAVAAKGGQGAVPDRGGGALKDDRTSAMLSPAARGFLPPSSGPVVEVDSASARKQAARKEAEKKKEAEEKLEKRR
jgi:hypothetical protein